MRRLIAHRRLLPLPLPRLPWSGAPVGYADGDGGGDGGGALSSPLLLTDPRRKRKRKESSRRAASLEQCTLPTLPSIALPFSSGTKLGPGPRRPDDVCLCLCCCCCCFCHRTACIVVCRVCVVELRREDPPPDGGLSLAALSLTVGLRIVCSEQ